jgi:predicted GNAT superfamily acetyltransferase
MSGHESSVCLRSAADTARGLVAIRPLTTVDQFAGCVELQRAVWGWTDLDLMPVRLFVVAHHVGGVVLGAYDGDRLIGFVNCLPGVRGGRVHWYSHMMAVLPAFQDRGVGTALKLAQRQHALSCGVFTIEWVFDPLQAKNAYLNVVKLGAVIPRYSVNHYGASSSPLHSGLETDRVLAEWRLTGPLPRWGTETRRITIPADIDALKATERSTARSIQLGVRAAFLEHLEACFVATDFERTASGCAYILRRPADGEAADREPGSTM